MLPIDQPVTLGPLPGLDPLTEKIEPLLAGQPDVLIAHRGVFDQLPLDSIRHTSLVMHMSGGTSLSGHGHIRTPTATVEDGVRFGADGVSVQVTFGADEESNMLRQLTQAATDCSQWGMPLMGMVYVLNVDPAREPAKIAHAARVAAELGCHIVKAPYTGSAETFAAVVGASFVPVVVAGGERAACWDDVLRLVEDSLSAGASGVCIGRNVFQHPDPKCALADLRAAVHGRGGPTLGGNHDG